MSRYVTQDGERQVVKVDGCDLSDWIEKDKCYCPTCGASWIYCDDYDTYAIGCTGSDNLWMSYHFVCIHASEWRGIRQNVTIHC